MNLLVSRRILKREFGRAISADDLSVLRRAAKVVLATPIAGPGLPAGTRLLKAAPERSTRLNSAEELAKQVDR